MLSLRAGVSNQCIQRVHSQQAQESVSLVTLSTIGSVPQELLVQVGDLPNGGNPRHFDSMQSLRRAREHQRNLGKGRNMETYNPLARLCSLRRLRASTCASKLAHWEYIQCEDGPAKKVRPSTQHDYTHKDNALIVFLVFFQKSL